MPYKVILRFFYFRLKETIGFYVAANAPQVNMSWMLIPLNSFATVYTLIVNLKHL